MFIPNFKPNDILLNVLVCDTIPKSYHPSPCPTTINVQTSSSSPSCRYWLDAGRFPNDIRLSLSHPVLLHSRIDLSHYSRHLGYVGGSLNITTTKPSWTMKKKSLLHVLRPQSVPHLHQVFQAPNQYHQPRQYSKPKFIPYRRFHDVPVVSSSTQTDHADQVRPGYLSMIQSCPVPSVYV